MKLALSVLGASAAAAVALVSVAIAQPPGRGGFGLLQNDANGDGRVTRSEFDVAQKARFDSIDANKDGSASSDEMRSHRQAQVEDRRVLAVTERFDALDTDGNGQLSRVEFSARRATDDADRRGGRRGPDHNRKDRAGRIDANADGALAFSEFSARGLAAFTKADANKDGVVTVPELQAQRPQRR